MIEQPPSAAAIPSTSAGADGMEPVAPLAAQLRALPLFAELPDDVMEEVAAQTRRRTVPPGEVLCRVGEPGDAFYVVDSGMVRVLVPTPQGEELVAQLGPGHWFGEMALITGEPRSATVVATTAVSLLSLHSLDFQILSSRNPEIAETIRRTALERRGVNPKT
jgi:voltage-gated potassium channel